MKINFLAIYAIYLCCIVLAQSCQFQLINNDGSKKIESVSQDKEKTQYIRKIYPNTLNPNQNLKCECGVVVKNETLQDWEAFIYIRKTNYEFIWSCMGVVIAHNLVFTSHKCLTLKRRQMRPYEAWRPAPKYMQENMAKTKNVMIKTHWEEEILVENIIYNPKFSLYAAASDVASGDDIAIIVVKGDLFEVTKWTDDNGKTYIYHKFLPVCLPEKNRKINLSKDILHRYSYYTGFNEIDDPEPGVYDLKQRMANQLIILDGKECDQEQNFGDYSISGSLCIRTHNLLPSLHGGLLLTNGNDGKKFAQPLTDQRAFLAGLGTLTQKPPPGNHISYAYFGNVFGHLDTIENVARKYNSLWCTTPPYVPKKEDRRPILDEWPWELGNDNKLRSETLDCACGLKNRDRLGKVAGGKDAIPYEFGWMVKFLTSWIAGANVEFGCGASIINDRVILTAAHCVVDGFNGTLYETVSDSAVSIGGHYFQNGEEEILVKVKDIIVHPGYILNEIKNARTFSFDLALIILEEPVKFANATVLKNVKYNDIRPICLPKVNDKIKLKDGTELTAIGWGFLNPWDGESSTHPVKLQKLQIPFRDMKYCAEKLTRTPPNTVFCVANFTPKFGLTTYDSGGPLAYRKPNGQYFQVGVASYAAHLSYGENLKWLEWLTFAADVQQFVPFIEYYSKLHGAKWCKI